MDRLKRFMETRIWLWLVLQSDLYLVAFFAYRAAVGSYPVIATLCCVLFGSCVVRDVHNLWPTPEDDDSEARRG